VRLTSPVVLVVLFVTGAVLAEAPSFRPVASVLQLMEAMVVPSSEALFDVGDNPPKDDSAWVTLRDNAVILAESGNLLMMRPRDNGDWMKYSKMLVDAGALAVKAAEAKDLGKFDEVADQATKACEMCHDQYAKKAKK
jgi:hypothetical protein